MSSCCVIYLAAAGRKQAEVSLAVYLPLVLPALFAPFAGPLAARLDPVHATWLLTGAAVALAACSTLALGLLAAAAAVRIPVVASLGHLSRSVLGPDNPPGLAVALLAGILLGGRGADRRRVRDPQVPRRWPTRTGRRGACRGAGRPSWWRTRPPTRTLCRAGPGGS